MTEFIGVTVLVAGGLMRDVRPETVGLELVERMGKSKRLGTAVCHCFLAFIGLRLIHRP